MCFYDCSFVSSGLPITQNAILYILSPPLYILPSDSWNFLGLITWYFLIWCHELGTKFFVVCEPGTQHMENLLKHIYELYTDYVLKNPFYEMEMPIRCELFDISLAQAVQKERVALLGRWPASRETYLKFVLYTWPVYVIVERSVWKTMIEEG